MASEVVVMNVESVPHGRRVWTVQARLSGPDLPPEVRKVVSERLTRAIERATAELGETHGIYLDSQFVGSNLVGGTAPDASGTETDGGSGEPSGGSPLPSGSGGQSPGEEVPSSAGAP